LGKKGNSAMALVAGDACENETVAGGCGSGSAADWAGLGWRLGWDLSGTERMGWNVHVR